MRGRILIMAVTAVLAALVGVGPDATAGPINTHENGNSFEETCLYWYDSQGAEQGWILLCGQRSTSTYGGSSYDYRSVRTQRSVQTCDAQGENCSDAYTEMYSGPADPGEFSMDITAGTASFNITLAGETPDQQCTVSATANATGTYSYSDPYPWINAHGSPTNPWIRADVGTDWYSGYLSLPPSYPGAAVSQGTDEDVYRTAAGSGTVCNWVETLSPGTGYMWSRANTSTTYSVTPTL